MEHRNDIFPPADPFEMITKDTISKDCFDCNGFDLSSFEFETVREQDESSKTMLCAEHKRSTEYSFKL